jgi:MFS family permease
VFYVLLAGLGFAVCGCQGLMPVLAARLYPPRLLATSISWIGACSRVGAICGPLLGGWMLLSGWSGARIMTVLSIPPLLCAIAFGALAIVATRRSAKRLSQDASDDGTTARQNPDSGQALPAKLVAS